MRIRRQMPRTVKGTFWKESGLRGALTCGLLVFVLGCAQSRSGWRNMFALTPSRDKGGTLLGDTVSGRIVQLEQLAERASSMSPAEASGYARSLSEELRGDAATPLKIAMVECLGQLPCPEALEGLGIALRDSDPGVRTEACRALSEADSSRAMVLLCEVLAGDEDVDVRLAAVRGLGRFQDPRSLQALGTALEDRDPAVQYVAMQSLERSTGQDLGQDVRRWKEFTENPTEIFAKRSAAATR